MTSERFYDSPLGRLTLTDNGRALTGIYFDTQKRAVCNGMSGAIWEPDTASCKNRDEINGLSVFAMTCRWLDIYFDGTIPDFTSVGRVPGFGIGGTGFEQESKD